MDESGTDLPNRARVLVVDDDEGVRAYIERVLKTGYEVTVVSSGTEAIVLLESGAQFDVVVTDCRMPGATGIDVLAVAKHMLPLARTVLMSGTIDDAHLYRAAKLYGAEALTKPVEPRDLSQLVQRLVANPRKQS